MAKLARANTPAKTSGWTCADCGRRFAKAKQWHSCARRTVDSHFAGRDPALRRLFDVLIKNLEHSGPLRVDAVKSSINLISRHHFGGVTVRGDYLRVGFLARTPITSPRIVRQENLGPARYGYHVVVRQKGDVDAELLRWLTEAQTHQS